MCHCVARGQLFQGEPLDCVNIAERSKGLGLIKLDLVMKNQMPCSAFLTAQRFDTAERDVVNVQGDLFAENTSRGIAGMLAMPR